MENHGVRRDFGTTWRERLAEARGRAATTGPELSSMEIANLQSAVDPRCVVTGEQGTSVVGKRYPDRNQDG